MASSIEVQATVTDAELSVGDVYGALRGVRDVSDESPITPGCRQAAASIGTDTVTVRVQGHDGEWSEESQAALTRALSIIDGVDADTVEVVSGGAEGGADAEETEGDPEAADDDAPDEGAQESDEGESDDLPEFDELLEDEESPDVDTIDGVGPQTAETLREAGIETVEDVLAAGADGLVDAGVSEGRAENIVEAA